MGSTRNTQWVPVVWEMVYLGICWCRVGQFSLEWYLNFIILFNQSIYWKINKPSYFLWSYDKYLLILVSFIAKLIYNILFWQVCNVMLCFKDAKPVLCPYKQNQRVVLSLWAISCSVAYSMVDPPYKNVVESYYFHWGHTIGIKFIKSFANSLFFGGGVCAKG